MAVRGVFASDMGIVGDRKGDFASAILYTDPTGNAPFFALSSGMPSSGAQDTIVNWFEENHNAGRVNITNNAGTGTTIVIDDATNIVPNNVYMVESTGEYLFVDSISGTNITVVRGFTQTTITAVDGSGTPKAMQRIGTAFEEASAKPTALANLGYPRYNYTQIFRNAWDVSGTARVVAFYTGDRVAKNRADCARFHSEDIERSMIWGRKSIGVKNNQPFRTMDGVKVQITTNVNVMATSLTFKKMNDFLQSVFERNIRGKPNERIAFCGNMVVNVINQIVNLNGTMWLEPGQTEFGLKVTKWITPFGEISLMTHPLMVESPLWTKDLYVLHPGAVKTRWLRRTHEDDNDRDGTRNGRDADFGVLTSELSTQYMAERTGGLYTGIDTAG
jgi:hypothetical protein